ncbi:ParA family protein [Geomicrobium sp. JSM 1781026]|uniref:ParA family protein n=1 Tax=Geomicrobium sp. JSM 1781026 TaxID=3344580 RepID=UPI0035C037B6
MKVISLFNHKGGVSKTTTTFNLAWKLAELGKKVLMVDSDPQCNLTGLCLNVSGVEDLKDVYENNLVDDIKKSLAPVFDGGIKEIQPANCFQIEGRANLFLLPGHIEFSHYDVTLSIAQELTGSLKLLKNIPGAINELLKITGEKYELDYIIIDMSPSVSATNANLLMQSDYFLVPCSPDYFCNMAIKSLVDIIPSWFDTYENLKGHPIFKSAEYQISQKNPKFIGTIFQRYRPRKGMPVKSFQNWIDSIMVNVNDQLVPALQSKALIVDETKFSSVVNIAEPYNISNIPDFNSLIAQSQKYNVPIYALNEDQLQQQGKVKNNMIKNRDEFNQTFEMLAKDVIKITS